MSEEQTPSGSDAEAPAPNIAPVLWLSLAILLVSPILASTPLGRAATGLLVGLNALIALSRSGARKRVVRGGQMLIGLAVVASIAARDLGDAQWLEAVALGLYALLLLVTPIVVVLRLLRRPRITLDTVAGALAAYVQFGLFFATLYRFVDVVGSSAFFSGHATPTFMDFQFFSFVTLTTLGYGNLVPAGDVGQTLAVLEAIFGQVFLVTIVAVAVGNLGAALPARRSR